MTHVGLIRLSLGPFLIHVLVDRLVEGRVLKNYRHDQEERFPQLCGSALGDAAALDVDLTGLVRRGVNAREGYERRLGMKAAHIADLSHELRAKRSPDAVHLHNNRIFGHGSRQVLHLVFQSSQRCGRYLKLGDCLLDFEGVTSFGS